METVFIVYDIHVPGILYMYMYINPIYKYVQVDTAWWDLGERG